METMREIIRRYLIAGSRRGVRSIVANIPALCMIGVLFSWAQNSPQPQTKAPAQTQLGSQPTPQTSSNTLPPLQLDGSAALHHLNQVISWYRHSTTGIPSVGLPSDTIYQDNTQTLGAQVVRLAFQSAKAETALIASQQKASGGNPESGVTTQKQNLTQLQTKISSQIDQLQSQIQSLNTQIAKTSAARQRTLISERDGLQGRLELQKALFDAVKKMAAFVETNGEIAGGLEGSVNQLARSIPEVLSSTAGSPKT